MTHTAAAMWLMAPHITVALTGVLVLVADLIWPYREEARLSSRKWLAYIGVAGFVLAGVFALARTGLPASVLGDTVVVDSLTTYFDVLFVAVGAVVLLLSIDALPDFTTSPAEFYALVIWCTLGNMLLAPSVELFTLFLALQLTSLPLIPLIGYGKNNPTSGEAALKYLVSVLVSTALLLYGLSLVYGAFGTSAMAAIGSISGAGQLIPLATVGLALMLPGFAFKTAAAPFQFWVPDVYQGAPSPVTSFLSVGSKMAGFALILRFAVVALNADERLYLVFAVLAAASMVLGNLGALQQTNIKRLLAYSGIAQAGYILVGLSALNETGVSALLFYLAAYGLANLLAFSVVIGVSRAIGSEDVADYAGLIGRSPLAAFALTVALMSLAGLPLTAGFMAKFYVFLAAAQTGEFWLVLIAVLNAVLAFYYYLRIVWNLYVQEGHDEPIAIPRTLSAVMVAGTAGVVLVGIFPAPLLDAAHKAAGALFGM